MLAIEITIHDICVCGYDIKNVIVNSSSLKKECFDVLMIRSCY